MNQKESPVRQTRDYTGTVDGGQHPDSTPRPPLSQVQETYLAHLARAEREGCVGRTKGDRVAGATAYNALLEFGELAGLESSTWAWLQKQGGAT